MSTQIRNLGGASCRIVGPYLPVGDTEWRCTTHGVDAVLRHGSGPAPHRREDFVCPVAVAEYESAQNGWGNFGMVDR